MSRYTIQQNSGAKNTGKADYVAADLVLQTVKEDACFLELVREDLCNASRKDKTSEVCHMFGRCSLLIDGCCEQECNESNEICLRDRIHGIEYCGHNYDTEINDIDYRRIAKIVDQQTGNTYNTAGKSKAEVCAAIRALKNGTLNK